MCDLGTMVPTEVLRHRGVPARRNTGNLEGRRRDGMVRRSIKVTAGEGRRTAWSTATVTTPGQEAEA